MEMSPIIFMGMEILGAPWVLPQKQNLMVSGYAVMKEDVVALLSNSRQQYWKNIGSFLLWVS